MACRLWVSIGIWCGLALVLMGCASTAVSGGPASADAFYAFSRRIPRSTTTLPSILNQLNGDIIVVTGNEDDLAVDAFASGTGASREAVRALAGNAMVINNDDHGIAIRRADGLSGNEAKVLTRGWLHVRVPPDKKLPVLEVGTGNIEVYGRVGNVTAAITDTGDIKVRGANGDVSLTTQKGSIIADIMAGKSITAHAKEGNLDLCAVSAIVDASTTNGWVRFIGTLQGGHAHTFSTTGAGSIQIAVPAYPKGHAAGQVYHVTASTAGNSINIEFPAYRFENNKTSTNALPICGFIESNGPYDYHVENTLAGTGRIEVSPAVTGTYYFTGTFTDTYYQFDTTQTKIAFFTPVPQSIHIYTAAQRNQIIAGKETIAPECAAALESLSPNAAVLNLKTDRGPIIIQHIHMLGDDAQ
jgi:hypothetical protein